MTLTLLSAVLGAISYGVHVSTSAEEYDTAETRREVLRVHSRINEAIRAGDAGAAERQMREHITATHSRAAGERRSMVPLSASRRKQRSNSKPDEESA
ncbi:DNA-binding FadR family transcriptional regulator [Roseomonas pecuniae]|uniref:DNA-binding FadR family transcriptional regulator n=2 Tax=Muricoccus pecuniae TaxID=693023 RepID=A0A840Y630_9PROT|nr:DNA-binding FadR family transcriptional regulator [Roseomonas pecuniae]